MSPSVVITVLVCITLGTCPAVNGNKKHLDCSLFVPRRHTEDVTSPSVTQDQQILQRINDVGEDVIKSIRTLEHLHGLLGNAESTNGSDVISEGNLCGRSEINGSGQVDNGEWRPLGSSKCFKVLSGVHSFHNATLMCRREVAEDEDLIFPSMINIATTKELKELVGLVRPDSSFWVNNCGLSLDQNCSVLIVPISNNTEVTAERMNVDCDNLYSVLCEKSRRVSYTSLVKERKAYERKLEERVAQLEKDKDDLKKLVDEQRLLAKEDRDSFLLKIKGLEEKRRNDKLVLEQRDNELTSVVDRLKTSMEESLEEQNRVNDLLEGLQSGLEATETDNRETKRQTDKITGKMSNLEDNLKAQRSLAEMEHSGINSQLVFLTGAVEELKLSKVRVEGQLVSVQKDLKVQALESKSGLEKLERSTSTSRESLMETASKMNTDVTEIANFQKAHLDMHRKEGMSNFDVDKALGLWFWIERHYFGVKKTATLTCWEESYSRTDAGLRFTEKYFNTVANNFTNLNYTTTVDRGSPSSWKSTGGSWRYVWLKTDYDNYGVIAHHNLKTNTCPWIDVVSRNRNLSLSILEELREFVGGYGVVKNNGVLINQTSC